MRTGSRPVLALGFLLAASAVLPAQQTLVVDANGGPGSDHRDLPAAVARTGHGDTLLVRPGDYTWVTIDKGITILAERGATVQIPRGQASLVIEKIPAGRRVRIHGLTVSSGSLFLAPEPPMQIRNCSGHVHLERVTLYSSRHVSLEGENNALVTMTDSYTLGSASFVATRLLAENCAFDSHQSLPGPPTLGMQLFRCRAELTQCLAAGSNSPAANIPALPAVRAHESHLVLRGDATSRYAGGTHPQNVRIPALDGGGSSELVIDPRIRLVGPIDNFRKITTKRMPFLRLLGAELGSNLNAAVHGAQGHVWLLWLSVPANPIRIEPFGDWALDLNTLVLLATGTQGASEVSVNTLALPRIPALRGLPLALQSMSGTLLQLEYTNPSVRILR